MEPLAKGALNVLLQAQQTASLCCLHLLRPCHLLSTGKGRTASFALLLEGFSQSRIMVLEKIIYKIMLVRLRKPLVS